MPFLYGIVIERGVSLGSRVTVMHQVTIGRKDPVAPREHGGNLAVIEDNVFIGAGAKVLGPVRIGRGATVGANAVVTRDVPLYLDEIGTCAAYETVLVQSQVSGVIIARHFQDGSDVKKGDPLFTIDPRPYQATLDQAKAQAALDQVTLKRQEDLRALKVISQQDYDTAVANAQKSNAATESAQVNLDYCYIKSPINGRIGLRNFDVGNLVGPSTAPLVTIQGLDPIYTDFTVAETDLALVRKYLGGPNLKVQTYLPDGSITPRMGDLYFIDKAVQPGSGTVKARGVTPNPDRALWPSQFVRVRFILDTLKDAMLVP